MTPAERSLIMALVMRPGGKEPLSDAEFLREFPASDGVALGVTLLQDAVARRDPVDVELALIVCSTFGLSADLVPILVQLAAANWHERHEDVATALGTVGGGSPDAVEALVHLATWVPEYLEFDRARALARKAVRSLGAMRSDAANQALEVLSTGESRTVADAALAQLQR
jgi:hypothetical protein